MQSTILNRKSAVACCIWAALALSGCGPGGGVFRQYEYEEETYLSLDGSATVYVNASLAALDALRGASFDARSSAPFDRDQIRSFFTTPVTSRRGGRRFVHVRIDVPDIRKLNAAPPFSWSMYELGRDGELFVFRQLVGAAAGRPSDAVQWTGREVVAFRLHLPSEIVWHNAGAGNQQRGNILVWEQPLADRLQGRPLFFEARIKSQSILNRTLWLFAGTFGAVAVMFVVLIWWILRRGRGTGIPEP
jgi:hypothetical protein